MKENEKKNNTITQAKPKYKVSEFYRDVITRKEHPVSMGWLLDMFSEWIEWTTENKDVYNPSHFCVYKKIPWETWSYWCDKYPEGKEAYAAVKHIIAIRREQKYIETNGSALAFMMPHYDKDYRDQHQWRSDLKKQEQIEQKPNITVIIPDINNE